MSLINTKFAEYLEFIYPHEPVLCSTDRSKAMVPVLVLLFVALWFILRGDLLYVFPCVILFLYFSVLLVLRLPRLGKRELILVLFVHLFGLCLFRFVGFLFLLGTGKGCGLWLWHSLDFSLTFFEIKETTETAASSSLLDCYLYIDNGKRATRLYDKRDDFNFPIINFPFLSSNIPSTPAYGVYVSQLIRYARAFSNNQDFMERGKVLTTKLLSQGYQKLLAMLHYLFMLSKIS